MTEILLGPTLTDGPTTKVKDKSSGKTFYKKRILPEGKFKYRTGDGKDVDLDLGPDQLKGFVSAFSEKAYDEVPFQFGAHSNDPTIRKGTLAHIEHIPGKGVDGYFELESDAAQYVEKYPNFGVSPRIVLGINRADGKTFEGAIQHVAGTVVPRMTGMGPWSKVELSEDGDTDDSTPIVDLSTETITVERDRKVVDVTTSEKTGEGEKVVTLSQDEYDFFKKMKKDYEDILGEGEKKEATASSVDLSEVTQKADSALTGLAKLQAQAIRDSWAAKRSMLVGAGVPPAALDLAAPVMEDVEPRVYDLSTPDGPTKVDAKTQMLGILELLKGTIDLSDEEGHGVGGTGSAEDQEFSPERVQAFFDEFGL